MDVISISSGETLEKRRITAIADSVLALCFLVICSFTLIFLYIINTEEVEISEVFVVILTVPLILNGVHLIAGVVLLHVTKKNTHHLNKCKVWCSISKYLTALVFFEMLILLQFQFKSLAFGIFGIQYLIRLVAIQKVKYFMQCLTLRSNAEARLREATIDIDSESAIIPYDQIVGTASLIRPIRCHQHLMTDSTSSSSCSSSTRSHASLHSSGTDRRMLSRFVSGPVVRFTDNTGELHLQFQPPNRQLDSNNDGQEQTTIEIDELPPPSYTEAMRTAIASQSSHSHSHDRHHDHPPSYNEVIKSRRARMHWFIAIHRKKNGKCGYPPEFI